MSKTEVTREELMTLKQRLDYCEAELKKICQIIKKDPPQIFVGGEESTKSPH